MCVLRTVGEKGTNAVERQLSYPVSSVGYGLYRRYVDKGGIWGQVTDHRGSIVAFVLLF
ncbi:hypothetical protein [Paenibacillus sp. YIM B09110]|uniref:hypothetical protein n=1 Tax=Paenibacillus sp. YIM B09110 TaxID=3126102 RepID=UPI00301DDE10